MGHDASPVGDGNADLFFIAKKINESLEKIVGNLNILRLVQLTTIVTCKSVCYLRGNTNDM